MSACEDWPEPERDPDEAAYELWHAVRLTASNC